MHWSQNPVPEQDWRDQVTKAHTPRAVSFMVNVGGDENTVAFLGKPASFGEAFRDHAMIGVYYKNGYGTAIQPNTGFVVMPAELED